MGDDLVDRREPLPQELAQPLSDSLSGSAVVPSGAEVVLFEKSQGLDELLVLDLQAGRTRSEDGRVLLGAIEDAFADGITVSWPEAEL